MCADLGARRMVVRYERNQGAILMPFMGSLAHY